MRAFFLVVIFLVAACGLPDLRRCSTSSECPSDAFCNAGACQAVLTVNLRTAAGVEVTYVSGPVGFQAEVSGGAPDKLELLRDGVPFAELKMPYSFRWDTAPIAEGSYTVTARATLGENSFLSQPLTLVVDRKPPEVTEQRPVDGEPRASPQAPIYLLFSEPVKLLPGEADSVVLLKDAGGASLAKHVRLSQGGMRLDVVPLAPPAVPNRLTLTLQPGFTDLAGNPLLVPPAASWTIPLACVRDLDCASPETCLDGLCQATVLDCQTGPCSVAIASPASMAYTNGPVAFQVSLAGAVPDKVELLKGESPLATLGTPYQYTWNTSGEPEGSYQIVARATQGPTIYLSEPRTVVVDRTPPVVTQQAPASGDRNVGLHDPIRVQFSEPVKLPVSSPESVVSLTGTGGVALSTRVALSSDLRTLQVSPVLDPIVPTDISLSVKQGIIDLAGNPLVLPGLWGWHLPMWLGLDAYVAREAGAIHGYDWDIDAFGRPTVAWHSTGGIAVAQWNGRRWEEIRRNIHGPSAALYYEPVMALTPSGEPVVAWTEDTSPDPAYLHERVFVKHRTVSGWEYLGQNPIGPNDVISSQPSLAVDATGEIWLGLQEMVSGRPPYHAVVRKYDGSLYWPQYGGNLNRAERQAYGPRLAFDGGGTLWAGWTESAGIGGIDNYTIFNLFTSKVVAGNWMPVGGVLNENGSAPAGGPKLSMTSGNMPIISWNERMGRLDFRIWYRKTLSTTLWGPPLAAPAGGVGGLPSIGETATGELFLMANCRVYHKAPGQADWAPWGDEEYCENHGQNDFSSNSLRTTKSGEILLLWMENSVTGYTLYVKRLNR